MAKKTVRKILAPGIVVNIEQLGGSKHHRYFVEVKIIAFGYKRYTAMDKTVEDAMSNIRTQFHEDCKKVCQSIEDIAMAMQPMSEAEETK